jgi:hypothetical protein
MLVGVPLCGGVMLYLILFVISKGIARLGGGNVPTPLAGFNF